MPHTAKIEDSVASSKVHADLSAGSSNGPGREEALFMMGQFLAADAKVKESRDARKRLRSQAKLRGFDLEQFDAAIAERERNDGTTIDALKTFKRYCEFLGLPTGSQMQLFDAPQGNGTFSQEGLNKRAYDSGYELGVMAKDPDAQAYPPMSPEGQEHQRGWNDGQKVNLDKIGKLHADMEAAAVPKPKKAKKDVPVEPVEEEAADDTKH